MTINNVSAGGGYTPVARTGGAPAEAAPAAPAAPATAPAAGDSLSIAKPALSKEEKEYDLDGDGKMSEAEWDKAFDKRSQDSFMAKLASDSRKELEADAKRNKERRGG